MIENSAGAVSAPEAPNKNVHHPAHYQSGDGIEAIVVMEGLTGVEGNAFTAIKDILRHQRKGRPAEDLAKARWYVDRLSMATVPRIGYRDPVAVRTLDGIAGAFGLNGPARHALEEIAAALSSVPEDRYRAYLRKASQALTRAIAKVESDERRAVG